ncbi:MAG: hypothetical protein CM15mV78_390 [uncultured marine virus]|nr:MAG: hypothetical protein CM15mV78_390 [uncultured marine virus]
MLFRQFNPHPKTGRPIHVSLQSSVTVLKQQANARINLMQGTKYTFKIKEWLINVQFNATNFAIARITQYGEENCTETP